AIKSSRFYLNLSEGSRTPISHDKEKPPHKVGAFLYGAARGSSISVAEATGKGSPKLSRARAFT
ncbi:MAG: hypothetical protein IKA06_01600, partial [Clostridia bacterium]|nr:hypothetical protein [Clostridia bacterium]